MEQRLFALWDAIGASGSRDGLAIYGLVVLFTACGLACIVYGIYSIIHTLVDQPTRVARQIAWAIAQKANAELGVAAATMSAASSAAFAEQSKALASQYVALATQPSLVRYAQSAAPQFTRRTVPPASAAEEAEHVTHNNGHLLIEIAGTERDLDKGFVYVIKGATHYKIGKARNVQDRLKQLSTGHENKLTVVHSISSNAMGRAELSLHTRFAPQRGQGEWFNLTDAQLEYLKSIQRIDVAGFPETQPATGKDDVPTVAHSTNGAHPPEPTP